MLTLYAALLFASLPSLHSRTFAAASTGLSLPGWCMHQTRTHKSCLMGTRPATLILTAGTMHSGGDLHQLHRHKNMHTQENV